MTHRLLPLLGLAAALITNGQQAEYEVDWNAIHQGASLGAEIYREWQAGNLPDLAFSPEEAEQLLTAVQTRLAGQDLNDLSALAEAVPDLIRALAATESGRAYADWLFQRYDYLVVADWAQHQAPRPAPEAAPPGEEPTARRGVQPLQYVTHLDVWRHRMQSRPQPAVAAQLVPPIKEIFAAAGVPSQLVWLAEVESTFNPRARSPVGAVGLFQFMPATAEWMGLALTPQDERNEALPSARAAARYLKYLYGRFEDWPLALAAYNYGEGNIRRLLRETGADTFSGIAEHLPNETRMYVPKILATIEVRENSRAAAEALLTRAPQG